MLRHCRRTVIITCIAVLVGGHWLWKEVVREEVFPRNFGVVEEGLIYRSGLISPRLIKGVLERYNIRVIIDLRAPNDDDEAEEQAAKELNIRMVVIPLRGNGTGDVNDYAYAVAQIVEAKRGNAAVLVHCVAGAQRTGGIIAVYQLLVEGKDPSFVIRDLKRYGWRARDTALIDYLNENMAQLAMLLKERGIIEQIPSPLPKLGRQVK